MYRDIFTSRTSLLRLLFYKPLFLLWVLSSNFAHINLRAYRENNENVMYHHIFSVEIDIIYQQKIVLFMLHEAFKININSLSVRFALT